MTDLYVQGALFVFLLLLIYFFSRKTINEIFYFFHLVFKKERLVISFVSLIFLPGTILHEMAHYFMALILFLKVREVKILPEWKGNYLKLGSVIYEKQDFVRGVIVGLAPILAALGFFWSLSLYQIFPSDSFWLNLFLIYIIFVISSTMFSSRQDLVDLIYLLPLILITGIIIYIGDIKIDFQFLTGATGRSLAGAMSTLNYFFNISLIINIVIFGVLKIVNNRNA